MLNFNRRDRLPDGREADKGQLRPAIYEPPASAASRASGVAAKPAAPAVAAPATGATPATATHRDAAVALGPSPEGTGVAARAETPGSRLAVGVNIRLKGMEVSNCDSLVIEGNVEATVHSKAMEIAKPGTLTGVANIDVAEIHGEFSGELTARTRLVIHGTGRVTGTIRYGKLVVEEGGELRGDVNRLDDADRPGVPQQHAESRHAPHPKHDPASH